jgi:hypothetical protein
MVEAFVKRKFSQLSNAFQSSQALTKRKNCVTDELGVRFDAFITARYDPSSTLLCQIH